MYYKFNGIFFASEEEAKECKENLIKNGLALESDQIIKVKLW